MLKRSAIGLFLPILPMPTPARRISHTGSTIGFRTAVQRFPDRHLTVIVLINREGSSPWTIAEDIANLLL
jgi:hypothetical protein